MKHTIKAEFDWEYIRHIVLSPGESMTGYTFQTRLPQTYEESGDVIQGMSTMSTWNKLFLNL